MKRIIRGKIVRASIDSPFVFPEGEPGWILLCTEIVGLSSDGLTVDYVLTFKEATPRKDAA